MHLEELIKSRRSIRKYKQEIIKDSDIEKILESARWAPSGLNNQPWRFCVIKDNKTKSGISEFTKYSYIIKGAPCLILVFLDVKSSYNRDKDLLALGASIQNMLLMVFDLGLGACWLGEILNKKEKISELLNLDENFELFAVLALGYPDEKSKSTRKQLKDLVINL